MLEQKIQEYMLNAPIQIKSVRHELFEPGFATPKGVIDFPRLLIINSGELEYIFDDTSFFAGEGSIIHLPGGKRRVWRVIGDKPLDLFWFHYDSNTPCRNYCGISYDADTCTELNAHQRLLSSFCNSQSEKMIHAQAEAKAMLVRFFHTSSDPISEEEIENTKLHHKLQKVVDIIKNEADNPELLGVLHSRIGLSVNHFRIIFKQSFGTTPGKYLQNYRLTKASRLLSEGNLSVKEVAYIVGYQDAQYFSRLYHRQYGYAPSQEPVIFV